MYNSSFAFRQRRAEPKVAGAKRHPARAESPMKHIAQGNALGIIVLLLGRAESPKALIINAFALSGRRYGVFVSHTQGVASLYPGLCALWAFQPALGVVREDR